MGLRAASVRRPHVTVMAPALTDTNKTQNLKLQLPPCSVDSAANEDTYIIKEKTLSKLDYSINKVPKGNELKNVYDNLSTLVLATELLIGDNLGSLTGASEKNPEGTMNRSPPMGDHNDKMGLQKAGMDNVSTLLKDKSATSEVDQLFNNLNNDIPVTDIGGAGDIGQNVEDIIQVITSIEGGGSSTTENDPIFPLSGNDITSNFEKLLNDCDMMNMSMEEQLIEGATSLKETQAKEMIADMQKKQIKLERRMDFLLRRLRKMQSRIMGQHISGEVSGVFEHVHRTLRKLKDGSYNVPQLVHPEMDSSATQHNEIVQPIPPDKLKPISQNSTKNLVRKLEMSAILQANAASRQRHSARYFGSGSVETASFRSSVAGMTTIPPWSTEYKQELQKVCGLLRSEYGIVQEEVDSEATASSSGGESCDEMQNYSNTHQQYLNIQKRAAWKYATERAAIASRWTWLQAQISDLEYRIRQHSDLHRTIRTNKGAVTLGGVSPPHSVPTSPTVVNGYKGSLPGSSPISSKTDSTANGAVPTCFEHQCARTRPLVGFRKRKLLQINGLHAVSKKAARPSTLRCGCVSPFTPCAVCTGRTDPTHPRDLPDYLSKAERISLIDPSFHPVFSLPEDISAGIHLEAIMKTPEWQQRRSNVKALKYIMKGDRYEKSHNPLDHRPKKLEHRRKYSRLIKPSTASALSAKIKSKFRGRKTGRHSSALARYKSKNRHARVAMAQLQALSGDGLDEEVDSYASAASTAGPSVKFDSPSTSPLLSTQSISGYQRRNRINSYDIDNIVIPYSVAASTRVEKLQYKEILTPKWRVVDPEFSTRYEVKNNGIVKNNDHDSDVEDLSEEAVITRHDRCEADEKKKFMSYMKLPLGYGSRSRSHKRTDSRAESSGANTPDPMSPHMGENNDNTGSPITSPPATPLSVNNEEGSSSSISVFRRRTVSQSRWSKDKDKDLSKDENRCNTPENLDDLTPFDKRVFPLHEDVYDKMLKNMPENHKYKANVKSVETEGDLPSTTSDLDEKIDFHDSESTESAFGDEDPNDPEWVDMERVRDRYKR